MDLRRGLKEGLIYSLSRWTDIPGTAAKWEWFLGCLAKQEMVGFDPRSGIPHRWSLRPEDTLALNFWTKNPANLIKHPDLLKRYLVNVHVTVTGWEEVELGAPGLLEASNLLAETVKVYGVKNVKWRFSPIPLVGTVVDRFEAIAGIAQGVGIREVFMSFLQPNDRLPETRSDADKAKLLWDIAGRAEQYDVKVFLCNEDTLLSKQAYQHPNLASEVCAPPILGVKSHREACGCALMVDPFTVNESCGYGCLFCYASDKTLSVRKRNTLKVLR